MPEPFTAAAARLSGVEQKILTQAAVRFDVLAKESLARAVGGGTSMLLHGRGGKRRPVRMGTKAVISGQSMFVNGIPKAQWVWLEEGTKPHRIPKGRRKTFLKAPGYDHPVRTVRHPGSRGKRTWSQVLENMRTEYPKVVLTEVKKALDG
jgi:hypothetical protein